MRFPSVFHWIRRHLAAKVLTLFLAGVVIPATGVALMMMRESSRALLSGAQREQTVRVRGIAERMAEDIRAAQSLLGTVAEMPGLTRFPKSELQRILQGLLRKNRGFFEVAFLNADGMEVAKVSRTPPTPPLIKRTTRLEFQEPFRHASSWIGPPFFSKKGDPQVLLAEGRKDRKGVLLAKFSLSVWQPLVERAPPGAVAQVVDIRGRLLVHPQSERVRAHTDLSNLNVVKAWVNHSKVPTPFREYQDERGIPVVALGYPVPHMKAAVIFQEPRKAVFSTVAEMRRRFLIWTLLFLVFFGAGGGWMVWRIVKPLEELRRASDAVARGAREIEIRIKTGDELEALGQAFQSMTVSIQALETLRSDLIHMVVHDLRSPLTGLMGSLEYTISGQLGALNDDQKRFLGLAHRSGQELLTMIQNLLDIAKLSEQKVPVRMTRFEAGAWADKALTSLQTAASADGKGLTVTVEPSARELFADEQLLGRVLVNLVTNALRHTAAKQGRVDLLIQRAGSDFVLSVRDNGEGIPADQQKVIFDKFVQGSKGVGRAKGSAGLGLAFCKLAVEAHGGTIAVKSAPGEGATFEIRIPFSQKADS